MRAVLQVMRNGKTQAFQACGSLMPSQAFLPPRDENGGASVTAVLHAVSRLSAYYADTVK